MTRVTDGTSVSTTSDNLAETTAILIDNEAVVAKSLSVERAPPTIAERFTNLDGFRGFLAFLVFLEHFQQRTGNGSSWSIFTGLGTRIGVYGFFALSSFLLTFRLIADYNRIESLFWPAGVHQLFKFTLKYAIRRIARIYPMYIAAVLLARFGPQIGDWGQYVGALFPGLSVWDVLLLRVKGFGIFWTIPIEVWFYLFIPPIAFGFRLFKNLPLIWVIPFLLNALVVVYLEYDVDWSTVKLPNPLDWSNRIVMTKPPSWLVWIQPFLPACLAAAFCERVTSGRFPVALFARKSFGHLVDLLLFLYFALYVVTFNVRWPFLKKKFEAASFISTASFSAYAITVVLLVSTLVKRSIVSTMFCSGFWRHLGKISYGFYLTHFFYKEYARTLISPELYSGFEGFFVSMFFTVISSTISYYVIEWPGMGIGTCLCKLVDMLNFCEHESIKLGLNALEKWKDDVGKFLNSILRSPMLAALLQRIRYHANNC